MRLNPDPMEPNQNSNQLEDLVESYVQEYSSLNTAMDEIDSFMDVLEQKTDSLYSEIKQLVEDNRKARESMGSELSAKESMGSVATSTDTAQPIGGAEAEKSQELMGSLSLHAADDMTESNQSNVASSIDQSKSRDVTDGEKEGEICSNVSPKEDSKFCDT